MDSLMLNDSFLDRPPSLVVVCCDAYYLMDHPGDSSSCMRRQIKELCHNKKLDSLVLVEPQRSGAWEDKLINQLWFKHSYRVEAQGFFGGIQFFDVMLWNFKFLTIINNMFIVSLAITGVQHLVMGVLNNPHIACYGINFNTWKPLAMSPNWNWKNLVTFLALWKKLVDGILI